MLYRITKWERSEEGAVSTPVSIAETRKRSDAARLVLLQIVRQTIEDNGGLDTAQGHEAYRKAEELDVTRGGTLRVYGHMIVVTPSKSH